MTDWIEFSKQRPTEFCYCWVMNSRKGAYGFIATWNQMGEYFEYDKGHTHLNPALDVTHWVPLPTPYYGNKNDKLA